MAENQDSKPAGLVIDYDKLGQALATSLKPALDGQTKLLGDVVANQRVLADTFAAQQPQGGGAGKGKGTNATAAGTDATTTQQADGGAGGGISEQRLLELLDKRDQQRQQSADLRAKRDAFVGEKMKDLPPFYRDRLGNDESKWATEEQSIRQQYQADFKAAGGTTAAVNGATGTTGPGTAAPVQTVDLSKLNPVQKIALGLRNHPIPGVAAQQQQQQQQQQQGQAAAAK